MKEDLGNDHNRTWPIWVSLVAVIAVGVGIFFYYSFLRQEKTELTEAIPTDALFVFEINDNNGFAKEIKSLQTYFNEMFGMDVLTAYETVRGKLPTGQHDLTISGHPTENGMHLLFNTRIERAEFKKLLRALKIDPNNYQSYEKQRIYTYGTDFKSLKFTYFNHILTISDNMDLVQKAVVQHVLPKNLFSDNGFKRIYALTEKNRKQNWLILNDPAYTQFLSTFMTNAYNQENPMVSGKATWTAFQIRMSSKELFLSGYSLQEDAVKNASAGATVAPGVERMLPFSTVQYDKTTEKGCGVYHFRMLLDSVATAEYVWVAQDTLHRKFRPLGNDEQAEAFRIAHPSGIYTTSDSAVHINLTGIDTAVYTCFSEYNGQFLFAKTPEDLSAYRKDLVSHGTIADNPFYRFSSHNSASATLKEYVYFNSGFTGLLKPALSEKGNQASTPRGLRVMVYNCTNLTDDIATVNLYFFFQ